jgi:hypothetical protein
MRVIKGAPGAIFEAVFVAEVGEPCQRCATPLEVVHAVLGALACPSCEAWLFKVTDGAWEGKE